MEIREATVDDLPDLARLAAEVQSLHVQIEPNVFHDVSDADLLEFFRNRVERTDFKIFVATEAKVSVAYVSFTELSGNRGICL